MYCLSYTWSERSWSPFQWPLGARLGDNLDGVSIHYRAQLHTHSHSHSYTKFEDGNHPTSHVIGGNQNAQKNLQREYMQTPHTGSTAHLDLEVCIYSCSRFRSERLRRVCGTRSREAIHDAKLQDESLCYSKIVSHVSLGVFFNYSAVKFSILFVQRAMLNFPEQQLWYYFHLISMRLF